MSIHRTIITVDLLWDDEMGISPYTMGLSEIALEMTNGYMSGIVSEKSTVTLTKPQVIEACMEHGTDPAFFRMKDEVLDI